MSDVVDTRVRELVKASSIETREAIFEDLVREIFSIQDELISVPLYSANGEMLGMLVRPAPIGPELGRSPDQEVEHQRRMDTIDDVVSKEELVRLVIQGIPAGSGSR